ncbi:MAG: hypothetical protein AAGK32_10260 [Actinomycetota bacterium]
MVNDANPGAEAHRHGDGDDDLLARLRAARPIDPNPQPRSDGPPAHALLESVMNQPTPEASNPASNQAPSLDPVLFADAADHDFDRPPAASGGRARRGYGLVLAAAAAAVVLVAGALALLPTNTEPALAAVQSAAQATADAGTGRVEVVATVEAGDGQERGNIDASVTGRYNGTDVAFVVGEFVASATGDHAGDLDDFDDEFPLTETRFVDGVLYVNTVDEGWLGVEVPQFVGTTLTDLADPREVLGSVQELVEADEVGPVTLTEPDGATVSTTHYRSIVDLGDETLGQSGWLAGLDTTEIDADGVITIDIYVGDDDLLRRLTVSGDLTEPENGSGDATFEITSSFYDIGSDITIEAPADAEIIDPMDFEGEGSLFDQLHEEELDG